MTAAGAAQQPHQLTPHAAAAPPAGPAAATAPKRAPLSTVVSVLVDEWSRSYTIGALQGDIESMCMLASAHFSQRGFGCIPHDPDRGHDWLARAKAAVVERAARDAKRCGMRICKREIGAKEKELEGDVLDEYSFTQPLTETALAEHAATQNDQLDDNLSSGSLAESIGSMDSANFSCGHDTNSSFIADVAVPSDSSVLPPSVESDGTIGWFHPSEQRDREESSGASFAPPVRRHSLRASTSHPDFQHQAEWRKWAEEKHHCRGMATPVLAVEALYEASESDEEDAPAAAGNAVDSGSSIGSSVPNSCVSSGSHSVNETSYSPPPVMERSVSASSCN